MAAALQIWSATYVRAFDALPSSVQAAVQSKVDEMGARLASFPHQRLQGRREHKLRVGDYRVLYEFDANKAKFGCITWATAEKSTSRAGPAVCRRSEAK